MNNFNAEDIYFVDGFLYIISRDMNKFDGVHVEAECKCFCLNAGYDRPIKLVDIPKKYPNVCMVIFESATWGEVYKYGNYTPGEWIDTGRTNGYA